MDIPLRGGAVLSNQDTVTVVVTYTVERRLTMTRSAFTDCLALAPEIDPDWWPHLELVVGMVATARPAVFLELMDRPEAAEVTSCDWTVDWHHGQGRLRVRGSS